MTREQMNLANLLLFLPPKVTFSRLSKENSVQLSLCLRFSDNLAVCNKFYSSVQFSISASATVLLGDFFYKVGGV